MVCIFERASSFLGLVAGRDRVVDSVAGLYASNAKLDMKHFVGELCGIPTPRTFFVLEHTDELLELERQQRLPPSFVVKPVTSYSSKGLHHHRPHVYACFN